jgi:hypothetical protein
MERRTRLAARQKWSETKLAVWVVAHPRVAVLRATRSGRTRGGLHATGLETSRNALGVFVLHSHVVSHGLRTLGCALPCVLHGLVLGLREGGVTCVRIAQCACRLRQVRKLVRGDCLYCRHHARDVYRRQP